MINRWSTLRVDDADVMDLGVIDTPSLGRHADALASRRPGPRELFQRWDAQQWKIADIDLEKDIQEFRTRVPARLREELERLIYTFIIGEYTGTDLLSPVLLGCPEEWDLLFVTTQASDEAKHTELMFRIGRELLGVDETPEAMLRTAWEMTEPAHRELSLIEGEIMGDVVNNPSDYEAWLRGVTLFHMVNEGVLAVSGQRLIVNLLGRARILPGLRSSFAALTRDESRHISYGCHALRLGLQEGHREAVEDVLERTLPLAMELADFSARTGDALWQLQIQGARRVFAHVGMSETFTDHVFTSLLTQNKSDKETAHVR
ncbi:ribonucleotide-diphosphate reductase subunit beta [Arthrobacter sp. UM1]|uniref:ribonucleotide-diphosphate reductase subunit beta n=1 Tax=Arthrobacter sp. UM1 TaxID=2766776 RepID=UPI001CF6D7FE|nr:ribonucleotide-diphosphate reductase subunit beta [Arthrobacter sp. UM1]MCB4208869.1 ribonucleotide-diphosphate reductase subunit beta [Arthrobacter sp. UM1]